uniref:Uncharacterized protein LOC102800883 n=1 Tax=Saccoglossus kowalevskii TaxID=10224 RepID=A0ABM0MF40_SACKO|nr:PREDICTED: uncharacterized protein LOC102800883 [Saccoglossus kowalevskii]
MGETVRTKTKLLTHFSAAATGCIVFPGCLGVFQHFVFRPLCLSSASGLASACGLVSVSGSGMVASVAVIGSFAVCKQFMQTEMTDTTENEQLPGMKDWYSMPIYGMITVVIFKLFGGRFKSVLPSHLLKPGAFARVSSSASLRYADSAKRKVIQGLGNQYGCHTCGAWFRVSKYIADHQPPLAIVYNKIKSGGQFQKQKFFPHCSKCAANQMKCIVQQIKDKHW